MRPIIIPPSYKYIAVFPTMRCNLNCSFCLNAFDKRFNRTGFKEISGQEWVDGLNRIESSNEVPVTLSGGEPFLHSDFIYIINNLKPSLNIDILTNLHWGDEGIRRFINQVDPARIKRNSPYASIRVSYHPEQMGDGAKLVENVKKLQDAGFSIGIWAVMYPAPQQLTAINQMQFRCRELGIDFRLKDHTGEYKGEMYGDYSKFPNSCFQSEENLKKCLCKTKDFIIGPDGKIYKCHRDLFVEEFPIGSILDPEFELKDKYRECSKYGQCHPCDVKVKTNHKQELGITTVEIKDIE